MEDTVVQEAMETATEVAQEVVPEMTKKTNRGKVLIGLAVTAAALYFGYRAYQKYEAKNSVKPVTKEPKTETVEDDSDSKTVEPETLN